MGISTPTRVLTIGLISPRTRDYPSLSRMRRRPCTYVWPERPMRHCIADAGGSVRLPVIASFAPDRDEASAQITQKAPCPRSMAQIKPLEPAVVPLSSRADTKLERHPSAGTQRPLDRRR